MRHAAVILHYALFIAAFGGWWLRRHVTATLSERMRYIFEKNWKEA